MISPAQDPYASRTDRSSAIISRQDPVVYEEGKYANALSGEQVGSYERDGFLLLEDVFSEAEVRALSSEVERMTRCLLYTSCRRTNCRSPTPNCIERRFEEIPDGVTAAGACRLSLIHI